ncbi:MULTISPECIES: YcgL domain-containing protein [Psychrobacter]|uniref:YcgL domain-containing protein PsycPRwf_1721 n=3 Tax=Psychrobacter TaxID=497 RepID=Y1721_PSYWF|nr:MULTISPECIES: YcgL domain-containing protein [Psychrobacter]A5WG70.1 RecName: Full=YcgL domain-containing protein PsycPRwf_1721 [Psychrobacter sp. PRwf-1]MUG32252.1 hypothetical protein [Psychrobacter sanguinis]UNK04815.1 YcgL domain-containing protein [Psychrobacter sp. PraFG1]
MHCDIYKFPKRSEMYVYIARPDYPNDTDEIKDWLGVLPKDLRQSLGEPKFLMHLDLAETKKLARVNKDDVIEKLQSQGYFVQTPPSDVLLAQAQARMKEGQDKRYD